VLQNTTTLKMMLNENKIMKQFYLDVNRLDLSLDGQKCKKTPDEIKEYLYSNLSKEETLIAIYTLTQTFLANYYIAEFKKLFCINEQHLIDNKNYDVQIDTQKKLVQINKEFRIVFFSENKSYIIDYCTLNIHVNLENLNVLYSWNYEFETEEPLIIESSYVSY